MLSTTSGFWFFNQLALDQLVLLRFNAVLVWNDRHLKILLTTQEDCELADELGLIASNNLSLQSVDIYCGFIRQNVTQTFLTNCKSLKVVYVLAIQKIKTNLNES